MSDAINVGGAPAGLEQEFEAPASPWNPVWWGALASMLFLAGPAVVEGSATLSGSGGLTASAYLIIPAAATPAGAGSLAATPVVFVMAASSPAASGTLSATGLSVVNASAAPTGVGGGDATSFLIVPASAPMFGDGFADASGEAMAGGEAPPPPITELEVMHSHNLGLAPLSPWWFRAMRISPPAVAEGRSLLQADGAVIAAGQSDAAAAGRLRGTSEVFVLGRATLAGASAAGRLRGVVVPNDDEALLLAIVMLTEE